MNKCRKKGFTLIEVIISLAIIMTVIAAFSRVAFVVINTGMNNKQRLNATIVAQNEIEKIRSNLINIVVGSFDVTPANEENYTVRETVTKDSVIATLYIVEIEVIPKDANPFYLTTKLFKKGDI